MIDHLSIAAGDFGRSRAFYDAVLEPLGYVRVFDSDDAAGYALGGQHDDVFVIRSARKGFVPPQEMHIAFVAHNREAVMRFHESAVRLGARSDGEPKLHPMYGEGYFAAFVIDADGYRVEAVYHEPVISVRADRNIDACVAALRQVHKADRYPSSWPSDPELWLTPEGLIGAWVARVGSSVVGHVTVGEIDPVESPHFAARASASGTKHVEIKRLFVVPSARGRGIASELLQRAVAFAIEQGYRPVLEVTGDRTAAIALYERQGWQRIATAPAGWTRASGERPNVHHYVFDWPRP